MNKVISREYVEKNYIHKDVIEEILDTIINELEIMKVDAMYGRFKEYGSKTKFKELFSYKYGIHDVLAKILKELEETKDENISNRSTEI